MEQLDRYVLSEIRTELSSFDWDPEDRSKQAWVGVVTDGTIWHSWRYPHEENPEVETIPAKTTSNASARLVAHGLTRDREDWRAALDDGFVSWISDSHPGQEWAGELYQTVEEHDWKRRRHDVMQSLHMEFVSARDRKVFGE